MTMGERIRQARQEAGLSQRELAGEMMTRNMLSALEHDGANPSIGTLKYLAEKLCKPMGYFLGEDLPKIPEAEEMSRARNAFAAGRQRDCLTFLEGLESEEFRLERELMVALAAMELARQAIEQKRLPYANALLQQSREAAWENPYFGEEGQRKWLMLAAQAARKPSERAALADRISGVDELLAMKAQVALERGNIKKAQALLDAMEQRSNGWNWLRAEAYFAQKEYAKAAQYYRRAEETHPVAKRLEICYRELEDYKMAYYYATKKE